MTTLAAIQGPSWVVVGYDSMVAEDGGRRYILPSEAGKIAQNGEYLIGAAGDLRAINILTHNFTPPSPDPLVLGAELDHFMAVKFIPALRKCFDVSGYGKDNSHDSQLLVVVNGTAYELGENFDLVRDKRGFYALGSGAAYALGAMFARAEDQKRTVKFAKETVQAALTIACSLDPGSAEPVMITVQHRAS